MKSDQQRHSASGPPGPKLELGRNQRNRAHHLFYSTFEPPPNAKRGIKRTVLGVRDGSIHFSVEVYAV